MPSHLKALALNTENNRNNRLPEVNTTLGEYEIVGRLGSGGMSEVYLAQQRKLRREVAIKVLLPDLVTDAQAVALFVQEARTIANLQHTNIMPIYDCGAVNGWVYLVMPVLRGGSLVERILRQPTGRPNLTTLTEIDEFLTAMASALDYAHHKGIVHCDIKPGNLLFDEHGTPHLTDFGIAMVIGSQTQQQRRSQIMAGSYAYMSPELWRGEAITPQVDQYALGLVIYALITGAPPFGGDPLSLTQLMNKHLFQMPVPIHYLRQEASAATDAVIMRAIAKHPADRFASIGQFAQAFHDAVHPRAYTFQPESHPTVPHRLTLTDSPPEPLAEQPLPDWASAPTRVTRHPPMRVSRTSLAELSAFNARIFISYRRADSALMTGRIYDRLVQSFGSDLVFRDLDSIPLGTNFKRFIENVVRHCVVELVIIGKDWINELDSAGRRRLDNPDDFVRVEIEAALYLDIPVVPVMIDSAVMPGRDELPPSLGELVYCNGARVRTDPDFRPDMDHLVKSLEYLLRGR